MKIKLVVNQENRADQDLPMKEDDNDACNECPKPAEDAIQEGDSSLANSPLSSYLQSLGKRKRKPKEMIDEISPLLSLKKKRRKKKLQHSASLGLKEDTSKTPSQVKSPTLIRAEEVQSSLGQELPTVLKSLVRSHVGSCFWMGLPVPFCKKYLPMKDTTVVLEDESGEEFEVKYISEKTGLSAGWRRFAGDHKLVEGDVLIFQLIASDRFKVYVIRTNDLTDVDGALSLLNLEVLAKQSDAAEGTPTTPKDNCKRKKPQKSLPLAMAQKEKQEKPQMEEQSGNDSDEVASEVFDCSKSSSALAVISLGDVKTFEDFTIVVNNDECLDSEIPVHVRRKYFELCCTRNAVLHDSLLTGLYTKLVAAMICEVVNIADSIRACTVITGRGQFELWDKSLNSFELLGMNVGFLRARVVRLRTLAFESEGGSDARRHWEAKERLSQCEDEVRNLEAKIAKLREECEVYGKDVEALRLKAESYELGFLEVANASW
ncbi:unnamed protein product [Cuscuta campestris]|uniref:TF-B3 domain-containing protein n=1 Tax=Cuscuta campestris TaxID=132261 RepID=A0A484LG12_9ASTE|nr:unnamed protein product [Cuscuta campestris]